MNRRHDSLRITIAALPPRPRALEPADLSQVFGGCKPRHDPCFQSKDCCEEFCLNYGGGIMKCWYTINNG